MANKRPAPEHEQHSPPHKIARAELVPTENSVLPLRVRASVTAHAGPSEGPAPTISPRSEASGDLNDTGSESERTETGPETDAQRERNEDSGDSNDWRSDSSAAESEDDEEDDDDGGDDSGAAYSTIAPQAPLYSNVARKNAAILDIHRRLGKDIDDVLDQRLRPKAKVDGVWVAREHTSWARDLLQAFRALVWHNVTMKEVNETLLAAVKARMARENKDGTRGYGERFMAVRTKEVLEAVDSFKRMGRTLQDPDDTRRVGPAVFEDSREEDEAKTLALML